MSDGQVDAAPERLAKPDRNGHGQSLPPHASPSGQKPWGNWGAIGEEWRNELQKRLKSSSWEYFIVVLIIVNAVTLGLETSPTVMAHYGPLLHLIDTVILSIFVIEIGLRMIAFGLKFWRDPWSLFDFFVIVIALVPTTGNFSVLRALRIIRVLRLVTVIPSMRRVVGGLLSAIPGMGTVAALLALLFYVYGVMATQLFGEQFPEWFGTIGASVYSLFQIMTLESWSEGIVRPVMKVYPYAWAFFIPFILMTSFTVLNLFIGIIVDGMQVQNEAAQAEMRAFEQREFDEVLKELRALRAELSELKAAQERR